MINLNALTAARRHVPVMLAFEEAGVVREETVSLAFNKITPSLLDELDKVEKANTNGNGKYVLARSLAKLEVKSDDIVDTANGDGPLALSEEVLMQFELSNLRAMLDAVMEASFPKKTTLTTSNSIS